ncbi:MAG: hypothetical protein ABI867_10290 [Kofleriaceae bacterium]
MSSRPALSEAASPRVCVLDDDKLHDVFDVLGSVASDATVIRVRSPFLFEIGEELTVRIEQDGAVSEALARVRAHVGPDDARITELELSERTEPRTMVSG